MNSKLKTTFHMLAVASVAGGILLAMPTTGDAGWFDRDDVQQEPVSGSMRRPVGNQELLAEQQQPVAAPVGAVYQAAPSGNVTPPAPKAPQAPRNNRNEKPGGAFSFFYKDEPAAPSMTNQPRRVPVGNQAPNQHFSGQPQPDAYMEAMPVQNVNVRNMASAETEAEMEAQLQADMDAIDRQNAAAKAQMEADLMAAEQQAQQAKASVNAYRAPAPQGAPGGMSDATSAELKAYGMPVAPQAAPTQPAMQANNQMDTLPWGASQPVEAASVESRPIPQRVDDADYPELADVPPMPERLAEASADVDARRAELESARADAQVQRSALNDQAAFEQEFYGETVAPYWEEGAQAPAPVASVEATPIVGDDWVAAEAEVEAETQADMSGEYAATDAAPMMDANEQAAMEAEFSALVAAPAQPAEPAWEAPQEPVAVAQPSDQFAAPEGQWDDGWEPAPMVAPQTQVTASAPAVAPSVAAPVNEGEWVDLSAGAQTAVPVEQVDVVSVGEPMAVSAAPEAGWEGSADAGFELAPPPPVNASVRTLPESRYAARHQSIDMERYNRRMRIMEYQRRSQQ